MKKLIVIGLLLISTISANAQGTIFNGLLSGYGSARFESDSNSNNGTFPAAKWSIIMDPLATFGSGMALGADFFVGRLQFRALGAYHTASKPLVYPNQKFGYSSFEFKNFNGFRLEFQLRKDLTESANDNSRFGAGVYANFRSIYINGKGAYTFNPNPNVSTINNNVTLSGQTLSFGPIFTFSEHKKLWYIDMHIGPGMIVNAGGKNNDVVGIDFVNPYNPGVMLKFGLVIGLNMK